MKKNSLVVLGILMVCIAFAVAGCGNIDWLWGDGRHKNSSSTDSTSDNSTDTTVEQTTVSGTVSPPAGVSPSSLTVVSLGGTSSIDSATGNFSTDVYQDGVALVAAMPEGKEFGLMNVVATSSTSVSQAAGAEKRAKTVAAYKSAASNATIELNAKTTAVSMVFISPYFLTNDPAKTADIISVIENDPKVAILASVVENVFNEADPLSNTTLQQALTDAVQSVINTLSAEAAAPVTGYKAIKAPSSKILQLPKSNSQGIRKALYAASPHDPGPYYADAFYISLTAQQSTSIYDYDIKSSGPVDWLADVIKIDPSQFRDYTDLKEKVGNNRTLYEGESNRLGQLDAIAQSYLRYVNVGYVFDLVFEKVLGEKLDDKVSVPSDVDGVYLIRAYSGGLGQDVGEKSFVKMTVTRGYDMDGKALATNLFTGVFDLISLFIDLGKSSNEIAKAGLAEALNKGQTLVWDNNWNIKDYASVSVDVLKACLTAYVTEYFTNATKKEASNFLQGIIKIAGMGVKTKIIDYAGKIAKGGMIVERGLEMYLVASPMETIVAIVGDPIRPSVPKNVTATADTPTSAVLSWSPSEDNVGVKGYKIYRNGELYLNSITVTSISDGELSPSTEYCYAVSAYDEAGNESDPSAAGCVTTGDLIITPSYVSVRIGTPEQLTVTVKDAYGNTETLPTNELSFSPADASIATVDSNGLVTGVSAGSTTVTVTHVPSGKKSSVTVDVVCIKYYPDSSSFPVSVPVTEVWSNGPISYWNFIGDNPYDLVSYIGLNPEDIFKKCGDSFISASAVKYVPASSTSLYQSYSYAVNASNGIIKITKTAKSSKQPDGTWTGGTVTSFSLNIVATLDYTITTGEYTYTVSGGQSVVWINESDSNTYTFTSVASGNTVGQATIVNK